MEQSCPGHPQTATGLIEAELTAFVGILQDAVGSASLGLGQEAARALEVLETAIPSGLTSPHSFVVKSVLVVQLRRVANRIAAPRVQEVVRRSFVLLEADAAGLAEAYVQAVEPILTFVRGHGPLARSREGLDSRVRMAMEYIEAHATIRPLRVTAVARACGISQWHLQRLLKRDTGCRFTTLVRCARTTLVRDLLESSLLSVKEISARTGYEHVSQLTREFKDVFRVTPSELRRRNTNAGPEGLGIIRRAKRSASAAPVSRSRQKRTAP
jgi:AraC-like DNA-binding protein